MDNTHTPLPAKLIYNPGAGTVNSSDERLVQLLGYLQEARIQPEVNVAQHDDEIRAVAAEAVARGFELVIVCGGDGTVESVANELVGKATTLGILPGGTRNNIACCLAIPPTLPEAVQVLRTGRRRAIDVGLARCGDQRRWFLEIISVGLLATLYEDADALQKGQIGRIPNLLAKFLSASAAQIRLAVDGAPPLGAEALALLGMNMPCIGANYRFADDVLCDDGYLDFFLYEQMGKLDLVAHSVDVMSATVNDSRIRRIRAREVIIHTNPPMPVLVDGVVLGDGPTTISLHPGGIQVLAGPETVPDTRAE
jgi:diacylglycerol kinase (ATP)